MERKNLRHWFIGVVVIFTTLSMGYFLTKYWQQGIIVLKSNMFSWVVIFAFGLFLTNVFVAIVSRECMKLSRENNELAKDCLRLIEFTDKRMFRVENVVNSLSISTQAIIRSMMNGDVDE